MQSSQVAEPTLNQQPCADRRRRKQQGHRPLGQHAESDGRIHEPQVAAPVLRARLCQQKTRQRHHHEHRHPDVDEDTPGEHHKPRSGSHNECGDNADRGSTKGAPEQKRREQYAHRPNSDGDAFNPDRNPEDLIKAGDHPVRQHGFVHPWFAVELGIDVVARQHHLLRRLDVKRLVRIPDGVGAKPEEQEQDRGGKQD